MYSLLGCTLYIRTAFASLAFHRPRGSSPSFKLSASCAVFPTLGREALPQATRKYWFYSRALFTASRKPYAATLARTLVQTSHKPLNTTTCPCSVPPALLTCIPLLFTVPLCFRWSDGSSSTRTKNQVFASPNPPKLPCLSSARAAHCWQAG